MSSKSVRIRPQAHRQLKELAERFGRPMKDVVEHAIEILRRRVVLGQANRAFAKLRANKQAWTGELKERIAWDETFADQSKA
jgi:predicted transcriptional regulator